MWVYVICLPSIRAFGILEKKYDHDVVKTNYGWIVYIFVHCIRDSYHNKGLKSSLLVHMENRLICETPTLHHFGLPLHILIIC